MKPYSLDLRQKILRAYDRQRGSQRALAALFGVSHAFLEQLLRRPPQAGGRRPRCDPAALTLIRQLVREQPDATLAELCAQLQQRRGLRISVATMGRVLQRLGRPRKKSPSLPLNATRRASSRPVPPTGSGRPRLSADA
jgi:transposase